MPLTWNITKVKDLTKVQSEHGITVVLIHLTMSVGMRKITEANADEFFARVNLLERIVGTFLWEGDNAKWLTKENITDRIGMTTNASDFSRAEFNKRILKRHYNNYVKEDK